jgi:hypothetical protein
MKYETIDILNEINSLRLEYPELESEVDEILDMYLREIENGNSKQQAAFLAKGLMYELIKQDK